MMVQLPKNALRAALMQTFESMAFTEPEWLEEETPEAEKSEDHLWGSLALIKPFPGQMLITLPEACGKTITQTLYGLAESELNDDLIRDTIAEILNTLAGRFLQEMLRSNQEFELGFPQTGSGDPPALSGSRLNLSFNLGGFTVHVSIAGVAWETSLAPVKTLAEAEA